MSTNIVKTSVSTKITTSKAGRKMQKVVWALDDATRRDYQKALRTSKMSVTIAVKTTLGVLVDNAPTLNGRFAAKMILDNKQNRNRVNAQCIQAIKDAQAVASNLGEDKKLTTSKFNDVILAEVSYAVENLGNSQAVSNAVASLMSDAAEKLEQTFIEE
jgi:hypothetical protein